MPGFGGDIPDDDEQSIVLDISLFILLIISIILSIWNIYHCCCKSDKAISRKGKELQTEHYSDKEKDEEQQLNV